VTFQRARRPEQVEARRAAILEVASALLAERPVASISLRELSVRVGLAKSNVLRYFDSREAIFLEVLDTTWRAWLDVVDVELRDLRPEATAAYARETAVARTVAASLTGQPLLCELISAMAGVLERNISQESARVVKRGTIANTARLAALVARELPALDEERSTRFAGGVFVVVAGLWPLANPTAAVATASAEMGLPHGPDLFANGLSDALVYLLIGLIAAPGR
jgi:AcrR family transcriptional regulator